MQSNNKKKICIVVSSLGKGGAERSSALLSQMLHNQDIDIHIVSILNSIHYDYFGTLLNLGALKDKNDSFFGRISRFFTFKKYLKRHQFDYIIDNRSRPNNLKELIISKGLYRNFKTIYVVRSNRLKTYFSKSKTISKFIYKKAYKIVAVSDETKQHIEDTYGFTNVVRVYNPVDMEALAKNPLDTYLEDENYILFYGRLIDKVKNVSLLIEAYKQSQLATAGVKLFILGEGEDETLLRTLVKTHNLSDYIIFKGYTSKPFTMIKKARFTVLTSYYEGFPRAVIEPLAIGTPVISVDCSSGPKEIIKDRHNGLLVENYNAVALSKAMDSFIFDKTLYNTCKANAKDSVAQFSTQHIVNDWLNILD